MSHSYAISVQRNLLMKHFTNSKVNALLPASDNHTTDDVLDKIDDPLANVVEKNLMVYPG